MAAIRDRHYDDAVARLVNDSIVLAMASEMQGISRDQMAHSDGGPTFEFMQAANAEYDRRGGSLHAHIGAVAEAIFAILDAGQE